MKWLGWGWRALRWSALTLLLFGVALLLFALSPTGARQLVALVEALEPRLEVGEVEGSIASVLTLRDITLRDHQLRVHVQQLMLDWSPAGLIDGVLFIHEIHARGVAVERESSSTRDDAPAPVLTLPVAVVIQALNVEAISVVQGDSSTTIDALHFSAEANRDKVFVRALEASASTWRATLSGTASIHEPYDLSTRVEWALLNSGNWSGGSLIVEGNTRSASVVAEVVSPLEISAAGTIHLADDRYEVDMAGEWAALQWPLTGEPQLTSDGGMFTVEGDNTDLSLAINAELQSPMVPVEHLALTATGAVDLSATNPFDLSTDWRLVLSSQPNLAGQLTAHGSTERIDFEHQLIEPFAISAAGSFTPETPHPHVTLNAQWKDVYWPLSGPRVVKSAEGSADVSGTLDELQVTIRNEAALDTQLRHVSVDLETQLSAVEPIDFTARFDWRAELESGAQSLHGNGRVAGAPGSEISLTHRLTAPFEVTTTGSLDLGEPLPAVNLLTEWESLRWPLTGVPTVDSAAGKLRLQGATNEYHLDLDADLTVAGTPLERISVDVTGHHVAEPTSYQGDIDWSLDLLSLPPVKGHARIDGDLTKLVLDHRIETPFEVETRGHIVLGAGPTLALQGEWRNVRWPLTDPPLIVSNAGTYSLNGPTSALNVVVDGSVEPTAYPSAVLALDGTVLADGFDMSHLRLDLLDGIVNTRGRIDWRNGPAWALAIEISKLDPGRHWPQWPGRLSARLDVVGSKGPEGFATKIDVGELKGKLRGYPVSGSGLVGVDEGRIDVSSLNLRSGPNTIRLNGSVTEQFALDFELDAPDLSQALPTATGALRGTGRLSGPISAPGALLQLEGTELGFAGNHVKSLRLDSNLSADRNALSHLEVELRDALIGTQRLSAVNLKGNGSLESHEIDAMVRSNLGSATATLGGGLHNERWSGRLMALTAHGDDVGRWTLAEPVAFDANRETIRLARACLVNEQAGPACIDLNLQLAQSMLDAGFSLQGVPLSLAAARLPPGSELTGVLEARGRVSGPLHSPNGTLEASISDGALEWVIDRNEKLSVSHSGTRARVDLRDGDVDAVLTTQLANDSPIEVLLSIDDVTGQRTLRGSLSASLTDLGLLTPFMPGIRPRETSASIEAKLAGTAAAPKLLGTASVQAAGVGISDLGVEFIESRIEANGGPHDRFSFTGGMQSGGGRLELTGAGRLTPSPTLQMTIEGQDVEVMRLPLAHVFASPDLKVSLEGDRTNITGSIHIPKATITPKEIPAGAVRVSTDEVLVNELDPDAGDARASSQRPMTAKVTLELGKEVVFDGFGLTSRIVGKLQLQQSADGSKTAHGDLSLEGGEYRAYGQRLQIQRGRLLFAGPLDNPGLDVRAVRKSGNVTAGLQIGGTVKKLQSSIFSEPSLSEAEALSYLLTGRPLSKAGQGEGAYLSQAALALGLQLVTQQLQSTVGLDEVSVGGTGSADDTSLVLGKRLTPDVTVRYALGLFDTIGGLFLNYRLTDNFSLEAESGARQGVDLLFNYDTD